ncbi:hypothetical protein CgunFtcFv8_017261 [Champsocephalus gunnari]|uniref:Uncharacterized protein n=1 Tax=Champsocephalus gunnari TaxID=52237 RepID=A0AAN8HQJ2_CHAGU|nr:hypothetical protein CgunFtcFv8_017261 [Champsocephalus gunnari]
MCRVPHVAHITASNPGSSTSLHTTSGAVGPGGLCGCTLRHISEKTLRRMKTARAGRSASERPVMSVHHAFTSVRHPAGCKRPSFPFLGEGLVLCVTFLCMVRNGSTRA